MNKPLEFLSIISCNKNILEVYLAQKNPQLYNDYKNLIYPHKDYKSFDNRAKHALDLLLTLKPFPKFQCIQPKEFESTIKNHFVMRTYISLKYDKDQKLSNVNQDSAGRKNAFSIRFSFSPFPILLGINKPAEKDNHSLINIKDTALNKGSTRMSELVNSTKFFNNYRKGTVCPTFLLDFAYLLYSTQKNNPLIPSNLETITNSENIASNASSNKKIEIQNKQYSIIDKEIFTDEAKEILNVIGYNNIDYHFFCTLNPFIEKEKSHVSNSDNESLNKSELIFVRAFSKKIKDYCSELNQTEKEEYYKIIEYKYISEYCFRLQHINTLTDVDKLYKPDNKPECLIKSLNKLAYLPDLYTQNILRNLFCQKLICGDKSFSSNIKQFSSDISLLTDWYFLSDILFYLILSNLYKRPLILDDIEIDQCNIEIPDFRTNKNIERHLKNKGFYNYIHEFYSKWKIAFSYFALSSDQDNRREILNSLDKIH